MANGDILTTMDFMAVLSNLMERMILSLSLNTLRVGFQALI